LRLRATTFWPFSLATVAIPSSDHVCVACVDQAMVRREPLRYPSAEAQVHQPLLT
jgi:hypothetical protein